MKQLVLARHISNGGEIIRADKVTDTQKVLIPVTAEISTESH